MKLKEAIEHARKKANELDGCECAKDHLQLAEWLEELQALKSPESATIVGYVARDNVVSQHRDLGLHLFTTLPTRSKIWQEWQGLRGKSLLLDPDLFPSVTWESEPLKVKLTITPIEE